MKKLYYGLNISLILIILLMLTINFNDSKVSVTTSMKSLNTKVFTTKEEETPLVVDNKEETIESSIEKLEEEVSSNLTTSSVITDVLETTTGKMSAYELNCNGCSGHLGSGVTPVDGTHTYYDPTYGNIRIVAGDSSYPYGTIVRVNGSKLGTFYAIVLDRGGNIGKGRLYMFDLLFPSRSDALIYGTEKNLTFEIIRYGF